MVVTVSGGAEVETVTTAFPDLVGSTTLVAVKVAIVFALTVGAW